MAEQTLTIQSVSHGNVPSGNLNYGAQLGIQSATHEQDPFYPEITTGGGSHNNTEYVVYNSHDYLKCSHLHGNLTGIYTSAIFDTEVAADRYLIYIVGQDTSEPDIVVTGTGTTWGSQLPAPNTWASVDAENKSWTNIFELDEGPQVTMRVYYGQTSPPTNYVDKMEILSAIVTSARYFQVEITIVDPGPEVYAHVEKFYLRLCQ